MLAVNSMNISHNMEEIQFIMVMRDGQWIGTAPVAELSGPGLIQWMFGMEMGEQLPRHPAHPGAERLRLENLVHTTDFCN